MRLKMDVNECEIKCQKCLLPKYANGINKLPRLSRISASLKAVPNLNLIIFLVALQFTIKIIHEEL